MWGTDKRERGRKRLQFVTADLSYHLMPSHDRFSRTRPETYTHAHSHMPTWLGLIFPRRPSVKQFVRKFNSSQMVWQRMMRNHCAVYNSGYSYVRDSFLLEVLCLRLLSEQNHSPSVAKCFTPNSSVLTAENSALSSREKNSVKIY